MLQVRHKSLLTGLIAISATLSCAKELVQPEVQKENFEKIVTKGSLLEMQDTVKRNNMISFLQSNQYLMLLARTYKAEDGSYKLNMSEEEIKLIGIHDSTVNTFMSEINYGGQGNEK